MSEAVGHLLAFCFAAVFYEIYGIFGGEAERIPGAFMPFFTLGAFFVCCILEQIFSIFVSSRIAALFSLLPPLVLILVMRGSSVLKGAASAVILGVVLRLCIVFLEQRRKLLIFTVLILDAVTLYLYFYRGSFKGKDLSAKILCVFLVILSMWAVQALFEKGKELYPIQLFLCLGAAAAFFPMGEKPIDWSPVVRAGEKISSGIETAAENLSYYFASPLGEKYVAGYSSFSLKGGKVEGSEKVQLILEMKDRPYHTFTDEETGETLSMRKTLYLTGGRGVDEAWFVGFLGYLYENGVDSEEVSLFSNIEEVDIEYAYLDTHDEIAPSTAFLLTQWDEKVTGGRSVSLHRKGYRTKAMYLDIDYGSPYLADLLRSGGGRSVPDYETACSYAKDLWGIELTKALSLEEYEAAGKELSRAEAEPDDNYLDVTGADEKLKALAGEITGSSKTDYDKCRQIESYLRQYTYDTNAVGGYDPDSDMGSSRGMADIAGRFLFDTGRGYCVHFTSSMVMLLRLSGIPARAATGYRYAFPFEKAEVYKVGSNCAHTWPEAYIEGAGWIPFEPTSGYYTLTGNSWHTGKDKAVSGYHPPKPAASAGIADEQILPEEEATFGESILLAVKVIWPFAASAVLIVLLLFVGTRAYKAVRYRLSTPAQQLLADVEMIKKSLSGMTPGGIGDRGILSDYISFAPAEFQDDLKAVFAAAYRVLYSMGKESEPTGEENELARNLRKSLEKGRAAGDVSSALRS
ncbi:MAG: transglutaminase-like domain-containing protein [Butyrivibrio sp.]|nr:transglutaminase-like domain-containing protein [Butyrivibrio sp.]